MKSSKGFTLIEIVIAIIITAILLPILGIVFYQIVVVPPEESSSLSLTNEISLLSNYLNQDVHRADTFTVGTFPYYGNFTWNDSTGSYFVSYYASCTNASNTSCSNHIVRQTRITSIITATPTPTPTPTTTSTPTPTPTLTPTPTPTATLTTQTYDYSSGGGDDKWASALAWNYSEWASNRPINPNDFLYNDTNRTEVDADDHAYSMLQTADNVSWGNQDTNPDSWNYEASSQLYTINVNQNKSNVTSLLVTWTGFGGDLTYNTKLKIWNFNTSSWFTLVNLIDPVSKVINTYSYNITSSPGNYISNTTANSSENVTLLASSDINGETPQNISFGDALGFYGYNSSYYTNVTLFYSNTTLPVNNFTFEAWVAAADPIQIDTPSTSGADGTSGEHYVFYPNNSMGRANDAGAGLSVGTNGIAVYEYSNASYMPALAVYNNSLGNAWNHIAVVYSNKQPSIYLNGNLVTTGLTSLRGNVSAPTIVGGGPYGWFNGTIDEVRVYDVALNQTQIYSDMYHEIQNTTSTTTTNYILTYNTPGTWIVPANVSSVGVLVVAGGGAGGSGYWGGGGGGGGVIYNADFTVTPGANMSVTVGSGGAANSNGANSVFGTLTATGGGRGQGTSSVGNGGSGGGGGSGSSPEGTVIGTGTSGQGNNGGKGVSGSSTGDAGGGGGAGAAGTNATSSVAGKGGNGLSYSISGTATYYGGGGGGGVESSSETAGAGGQGGGGAGGKSTVGTAGTANTGGGGGGGGGSSSRAGGTGGSGVVIITYQITESTLYGYWKFNDTTSDSSMYNNTAGNLSTPAPQYVTGVQRDLTVYTDYISMTVTTPGIPLPTVPPPPAPVAVQLNNTAIGTTQWTVPANVTSVQVLVVGGGGGGGGTSSSYQWYASGGGGAGGLVYNASYPVTPGQVINITVGAGGAGNSGADARGATGSNSFFGNSSYDITAIGGGGGGSGGSTSGSTYRSGRNGGSGGGMGVQDDNSGNAGAGTSLQGQNGGTSDYECCLGLFFLCYCLDHKAGGGGGGANGAGTAGTSQYGGDGGTGADYSSIFGTGVGASGKFAGGGGGGAYDNAGAGGEGGGAGSRGNANGGVAIASSGGGGGGCSSDGNGRTGGAGGSGIVIVKYTLSYKTLDTSASAGGSVTPAPPGANYITGTLAGIVATPNPCYSFVNWTGDTSALTGAVTNATNSIDMSANHSIAANFAASNGSYTLALVANPTAGGNPSFNGSQPFGCNVSVPIHANPSTGYTFSGWTPTSGIGNPSAADTTVQMTGNLTLTANYTANATATPTPAPISNSSLYLTRYITAKNFSLSISANNYIVADMKATTKTSNGKYVQKQLTIFILQRPQYLFAQGNMWGNDVANVSNSFVISGQQVALSGDVKINGSVTVVPGAAGNMIDGVLRCPKIIGDNQSALSYTTRINGTPLYPPATAQQAWSIVNFATNLTNGTTDWGMADQLHEYVFTGNVNLATDAIATQHVWLNSTTLKPGMYYSPGTITLSGDSFRGTVTFIAGNRIIISNTQSGGDIASAIDLNSFNEDLLFWANGSVGNPTTAGDGAILIQGSSGNHPCVSLNGVLFAPNGEIEIAGSGMSGGGFLKFVNTATIYRGALVGKDISISGSYWNIYRW